MLGYALDEIEPSAAVWEKLLHPDDKARIQPVLEANMRGAASSWTWEQRLRHKDGHWVWILGAGAVVERAPDGTPLRAAGTHADITDQKRASAELAEAHRQLAIHVSNTPLALAEWDGDYRVTRFTTRAEEMFGWREEEVLGKRIDEVPWVPEEDWPKFRAMLEAMYAGRAAKNVDRNRHRRKDGTIIHCEWHNSSLYGPDGKLASVFSLIQDVTAREEAEEALRESQRMLLQSQKMAQIGSYVLDVKRDHWSSSSALDAIFGIDQEYPRTGSDWVRLVHPEDRQVAARALTDSIASGSRFDHQYRIVNRKSGETRWVHGLGEFERGPGGELINLVGTIQDITSRKLAEVEREALQGKLALASRLAAMGTLVAGVAHEINNPLVAGLAGEGVALEEARAARKRIEEGGPADIEAQRRHLETIIESLEDASEGTQRVARIVKDLASFANPDPKRTTLSLATVASNAIRWMPAELSQGADVHVEDEGAPAVLASAGQIEQVVVNLLTNAAKAAQPGKRGHVVVRIGPGAPGKARIDVVDQGVGIEPKIRERVFEPFYTTRPAGEGRGAGLGLAICHTIVTEHGGTISVESEVGKGSTFRVELPAAPVEA